MITINANSEAKYGCPYCGHKPKWPKGSHWQDYVEPPGGYQCRFCERWYKIAAEGEHTSTHPFRPSKQGKRKK